MTTLPTPYQTQIHLTKYSRWQEDLGRRETWEETVTRYIEFWRGRVTLPDTQWKRLKEGILNGDVVPSMRCLMTAGTALEKDEVAGYNCFGGDTQVVTRKGLAPIRELVGEQELLTSAGWATAPVRSFGVQDTVEAVFHYGSRTKCIRVTEDHDWVTDRGRVTTVDLRRGDQVPIVTADRTDIDTTHEDYVLGRTHGLIYGDGAAYHKKQRAWGYQIRVCSDQNDIEPLLAQYKSSSPPSYDGDNVFFVREPAVPMKDLPFDHESDEYVLGFFRGWFAADGHVGETGICSMMATDEAAEWAARVLPRVGIHVSSTKNIGGSETNFGKRRANACHIHFQAETLVPEDILIARKRERLVTNPKRTYWSFTEITPASSRKEEVFCATVDNTHDFVIDGAILTGNCSYMTISRPHAFDEVMYLLMCGVGVGFSVEERYVSKLPDVPHLKPVDVEQQAVIKVGDSKYGWAEALRRLIRGLYAGEIARWDLSDVRPAGAPLKTFGGRASGPKPLDDLMRHVVQVFTKAQGRKLTDIECHSIVTKIGDIVVVGGVRRSAEISLFDATSDRMVGSKSGEWWHNNPHFALANNSAVWHGGKPTPEHFLEVMTQLVKSKSGEPGIFNRDAAKRQAARTGRRNAEHEFGCNPCGEIILRDRQLCNLTEVIARPEDTVVELMRKVELATILGTVQSTLTKFKHLSPQWQRNCEEERLLGVSITGIYDCPALNGRGSSKDELGALLDALRDHAVDTNKKYAAKLGIPQSTAITCVKPSGNTSQLMGSSSGIHPRHAKYIIRRNRGNKTDPVARLLADSGVPHEDEIHHPDTTWVFSWPQRAPETSVTRDEVTALEQLELWLAYHEHWCEHKPSITVSVRDDEWPAVVAWVWEHWEMMSGVAFLPFDDHSYVQAPYEAVTEEELAALEAQIPTLHWGLLTTYETEDRTEGHRELACTAGACEL